MHAKKQVTARDVFVWSLMLMLLLVSCLVSLSIGAYHISVKDIFCTLFQSMFGVKDRTAFVTTMETALYEIRVPRIILAIAVGMSLAGSGVSLQALFRNPLIDPFILGVSAGAALGAALSLAFLPHIPVQIVSFVCGLSAVTLVLFLARSRREVPVLSLILAGIVVSSLFSAGVAVIQLMVDPYRLGSIIFWLMGSLTNASWKVIVSVVPLMVFGLVLLHLMRWRLNILSMGEEEARALGVNASSYRTIIIVIVSLLTALSVSACGIIGWVGLMVPHMARLIVGSEHKRLVPFTILSGGIFMLWVDTLARGLTDFEIPVGIITSLCGAPFFMFLLKRSREIWES